MASPVRRSANGGAASPAQSPSAHDALSVHMVRRNSTAATMDSFPSAGHGMFSGEVDQNRNNGSVDLISTQHESADALASHTAAWEASRPRVSVLESAPDTRNTGSRNGAVGASNPLYGTVPEGEAVPSAAWAPRASSAAHADTASPAAGAENGEVAVDVQVARQVVASQNGEASAGDAAGGGSISLRTGSIRRSALGQIVIMDTTGKPMRLNEKEGENELRDLHDATPDDSGELGKKQSTGGMALALVRGAATKNTPVFRALTPGEALQTSSAAMDPYKSADAAQSQPDADAPR